MASNATIILSPNPKGQFLEGIVSGTPKPGTMMQVKAATEPVAGRFTYEVFNDADGANAAPMILLEDDLQGKLVTEAYVTGHRCRLYIPAPGELIQVLLADVAGTGDDHAIGDKLICDSGTGKFNATTGSPESEPFVVMETITDPTSDTLCKVMATGN